jgi:hypothetical protein
VLAQNGWTVETPQFRREYLGEWVHDKTTLALPFDWMRNACAELPGEGGDGWEYSLGVDVGTVAPSAFVVVATCRGLPEMYVTRSFQREGLTPSGLAGLVQGLDAEYRFRAVWIDTGGLGAGYAAELAERYGVGTRVFAAKKTDKRSGIEVVRGELHTGNLKILTRENRDLVQEMAQLPLNQDGTNFDSEHFACHLSDALVYAVRGCRPHYNAVAERRPMTDQEYQAERMRQHKQRAMNTAIENAKRNRRP